MSNRSRYISSFGTYLPLLWAEAVQAQNKRRGARRVRPGVTVPRINIGDLVLVAQTTCPHKLRMHWTGPHEVVATVNKCCYRVRPLLPPPQKRPTITAHIVRISRFSNAALNTPADRRRLSDKDWRSRQSATSQTISFTVSWDSDATRSLIKSSYECGGWSSMRQVIPGSRSRPW